MLQKLEAGLHINLVAALRQQFYKAALSRSIHQSSVPADHPALQWEHRQCASFKIRLNTGTDDGGGGGGGGGHCVPPQLLQSECDKASRHCLLKAVEKSS